MLLLYSIFLESEDTSDFKWSKNVERGKVVPVK